MIWYFYNECIEINCVENALIVYLQHIRLKNVENWLKRLSDRKLYMQWHNVIDFLIAIKMMWRSMPLSFDAIVLFKR